VSTARSTPAQYPRGDASRTRETKPSAKVAGDSQKPPRDPSPIPSLRAKQGLARGGGFRKVFSRLNRRFRREKEGRGSSLGGSVATSLLLVLTADCKARNAPRFASPSAIQANESAWAF